MERDRLQNGFVLLFDDIHSLLGIAVPFSNQLLIDGPACLISCWPGRNDVGNILQHNFLTGENTFSIKYSIYSRKNQSDRVFGSTIPSHTYLFPRTGAYLRFS